MMDGMDNETIRKEIKAKELESLAKIRDLYEKIEQFKLNKQRYSTEHIELKSHMDSQNTKMTKHKIQKNKERRDKLLRSVDLIESDGKLGKMIIGSKAQTPPAQFGQGIDEGIKIIKKEIMLLELENSRLSDQDNLLEAHVDVTYKLIHLDQEIEVTRHELEEEQHKIKHIRHILSRYYGNHGNHGNHRNHRKRS
jgi:hypothetical protein